MIGERDCQAAARALVQSQAGAAQGLHGAAGVRQVALGGVQAPVAKSQQARRLGQLHVTRRHAGTARMRVSGSRVAKGLDQ
jgi:hypothetical protein